MTLLPFDDAGGDDQTRAKVDLFEFLLLFSERRWCERGVVSSEESGDPFVHLGE